MKLNNYLSLLTVFSFISLNFNSSKASASVLGAYYLSEQIRLNHLGYTQNILPVEMPWGETCRISYFYHRSSKAERRTILLHGFLDRSLTWRHAVVNIPKSSLLRKSLIMIDLPHHGDSRCPGVDSFTKAETFLVESLRTIREKENFKVEAMWSGSLGGLFGLTLLNHYPEAQLTMIVPPLLAKPYAKLKAKEISDLSTRDQLENFLKKVPPADRKLPLVGSIISGLLPRAQIAKQLVSDIDSQRIWNGFTRASKTIRIMVSQDDLLLPIKEMDPKYTSNRKSVFQIIDNNCGHSILRFCANEVTPFLLNADYLTDI
jgi:pimeloyl-ACP methyl ester carboxylesterase